MYVRMGLRRLWHVVMRFVYVCPRLYACIHDNIYIHSQARTLDLWKECITHGNHVYIHAYRRTDRHIHKYMHIFLAYTQPKLDVMHIVSMSWPSICMARNMHIRKCIRCKIKRQKLDFFNIHIDECTFIYSDHTQTSKDLQGPSLAAQYTCKTTRVRARTHTHTRTNCHLRSHTLLWSV